jgi:hypothetical protein
MAQNAVLHAPGDLTVVASATVLAIEDLQHVDVVPAGFELETQVAMADFAAETDPVEPVWKDDRTYPGIIRIVIDDDVPVLGNRIVPSRAEGDQHHRDGDGREAG